jgi:hypothetical protein
MIRPKQSPSLGHSAPAAKPGSGLTGPPALRSNTANYHGAATARPTPSDHHTNANSQTVLAKDPAQDLPEFDRPRSAEILTSTSIGAHNKPLDPALDKPIDPGALQSSCLAKLTSNHS